VTGPVAAAPSQRPQGYAKDVGMTLPDPTIAPASLQAATLAASEAGVLQIDLDAIASNWRALAARVQPAECGAVVKADAYGLGVARVLPALAAAGCRSFFVATPGEAIQARALTSAGRVFVLDGLFPGAADAILRAGAVPCLASLAEVEEWSSHARRIGARLATALHVDSGLNRLGLPAHEVAALVDRPDLLAALDVVLIMSHLASADDPADPVNAVQRQAFERLRAFLPRARASLAASDGLMLGPAFHFDLVRPGYALYGGQAFRGARSPVAPVVSLHARVLQVRDVVPGGAVGYSGSWRASRPSRIATLATGYADGFARTASAPSGSPGGSVVIHGARLPVVGRVSMDLITVDVTDCPVAVARGDMAEIIGATLPLETVGAEARTIGYEVLTRLGRRFQRVYTGGGA
jgi:alanine racemase